MVELVVGAVGGHIGHVEAVGAAAATHHRGVAFVELQPHRAIDGLLGAIDKAIEGFLEGAVPEALVHQVGPAHLDLALVALHIRRQGEALELLVSLNQQQQARGFVDLPTLDAHHPVFHHVEPAKPMAAGQGVGLANQAHGIEPHPINAHRVALLKADLNGLGSVRSGLDRAGHGIDLLGGLHVGILQGASLNRAAQQVEIDGIGRLFTHR